MVTSIGSSFIQMDRLFKRIIDFKNTYIWYDQCNPLQLGVAHLYLLKTLENLKVFYF